MVCSYVNQRFRLLPSYRPHTMHLTTPTSVASEIPLDVLEVIFKSLPARDLSACCRVNKAVKSIAFEALYRDLQPQRRNVMPLCLKLCNDHSLAHRVRSFVMYDASVDMFLGIIQDTLPLLSRLHTLVLFVGPLSSWILPKPDACPFQLTTFSCSFLYNEYLASFLGGQMSLRHLSVSGATSLNLIRSIKPRLLLPNLVSLRAPLSVADALIPGRPVQDVVTFSTIEASPGFSISSLSRSTSANGVQRLMVNFGYLRQEGCEQLAQAAPKLLSLTIDADDVSPDDDAMIEGLTEWIERYLSYAKQLDCLTVQFHPALSVTPCQQIDFSDMITSIFAASVKLRHIIITFLSFKAKYICRQVPGYDWYIVNE